MSETADPLYDTENLTATILRKQCPAFYSYFEIDQIDSGITIQAPNFAFYHLSAISKVGLYARRRSLGIGLITSPVIKIVPAKQVFLHS